MYINNGTRVPAVLCIGEKKLEVECPVSNEHDILLEREKEKSPKVKIERKEGEPTPAFK